MEERIITKRIWKTGSSLVITIPNDLVVRGDYKIGDLVDVIIRKVVKKNKKVNK